MKSNVLLKKTIAACCSFMLALVVLSCAQESPGKLEFPATVDVEEISLNKTILSMVVGDVFTIKATVSPEKAVPIWTSSDVSVATVDSKGTVTAISGGEAIISASSKDGDVRAECRVKVITYKDDEVEFYGCKNEGIQINVSKLKLINGTMEVLDAQLAASFAGKKVIWSSSKPEVVSVDASGMITCYSIGDAYIVANIENTEVSDTCHVSVTDGESGVVWYGDSEKSLQYSFYRVSREGDDGDPSPKGTITTIDDSEYGKIWKVFKPAGDKRCEFSRTEGTGNNYRIKEGDRVYVGWRVKMHVSGDEKPQGYAQFQLKTDGNGWQNHPVDMGFNPTASLLNVSGIYPVDKPDAAVLNRTTKFYTQTMNEDEWTEIVLGFNFSQDPSVSFVEVWINGVRRLLTDTSGAKVFKAYHRTIDSKADNSGPATMYFKWGIYNAACKPYEVTAYFDEMRIGKSLKDVMNPLLLSRSGK